MAEHGTRWKYNSGCRCRDCVQSNRDYARSYQRRVADPNQPPQRRRKAAPVSSAPAQPSGPGPVELAALEELATLSAAESRLGAVQSVLAMCRILDDPHNYPLHTRAAGTLESVMKLLRKASGVGGRQRGRLVSVHTIKPRRHRAGEHE